MNDSIEKLQLDISITGNIKESIANVEALATAISHLNAKVQELEVKGFDVNSVTAFDGNLKKVAQTTKVVTEELTDAQKRYNELASLFTSNKISNEQYKEFSKLAEQFGKMEKGYASLVLPTGELIQPKQRKMKVGDSQQKTPKVPTDLDLDKINSQTQIYIEKLKLVQEALKDESITTEKALSLKQQEYTLKKKIADSIKKTTKEQENANKKDEKSEKSKFIAQTKRIAIYRLIRYILKEITKSVQETASEVSKISPEFNKTLSQTTSSLQVLKGSVGVFANSLLPIIEPILKSVSVAVGNIANALSALNAKLSGQGEYIKVNTEYLKDYQSTINGTLLSFDTFNTLSVNNKSGLFSTESIENLSTELEKASGILTTIVGTLATISAMKIMTWIQNGGLKKLAESLNGVKIKISEIGSATLIVGASIGWVTSILNLIDVIKNWNSQSLITKITAITATLTGLASVVFAILSATGVGNAVIMKSITTGLTAGTLLLTGVSAMKFANGGMFEGAGTMYAIAGESGAEIVAKGSQGTGVANVEQISDAMYLALVRYGVAKGNLNNASISLDGQKVGKLTANSSYREMVRQGLI